MTEPVYFFLALLIMAGITYLIRLLPLLFVRKRIKNKFLKSFLYYVPYVVLSVIAFPAIFFSTDNLVSGIVATVICAILAYRGKGLIICMGGGIISALLCEIVIMLL